MLDDTIEVIYWDGPTDLRPDAHLPMWSGAPPVLFRNDCFGAPQDDHVTGVRAVWTARELWLLFECAYENLTIWPAARADIETERLWEKSDVAEAFVGPDPADILRYKEFQVSPAGEWVDLAIDRVIVKHDWTWDSGFKVAARVEDACRTWWAVMAIPLDSFGVEHPVDGVRWRANFFRIEQGPPRRLIAWRPPLRLNFHTPEAFGGLVFKKP